MTETRLPQHVQLSRSELAGRLAAAAVGETDWSRSCWNPRALTRQSSLPPDGSPIGISLERPLSRPPALSSTPFSPTSYVAASSRDGSVRTP